MTRYVLLVQLCGLNPPYLAQMLSQDHILKMPNPTKRHRTSLD